MLLLLLATCHLTPDVCVPLQQQTAAAVATKVFEFTEGAAWRSVRERMESDKVTPIRADFLHVEKELDAAFSLAQQVSFQQNECVTTHHTKRDVIVALSTHLLLWYLLPSGF